MPIIRRLPLAVICLLVPSMQLQPACAQATQFQQPVYPYYQPAPQQANPYYQPYAQPVNGQPMYAQPYAQPSPTQWTGVEQQAKLDEPTQSSPSQFEGQVAEEEKQSKRKKKNSGPTPFEIQDQAVNKALAENKIVDQAKEPDYSATWSDAPSQGSHSKLKGLAATTGKVIGRTAAIAVPTLGLFFLNRALNQSYINSQMGSMRGQYP
jgi:hypothetical protein